MHCGSCIAAHALRRCRSRRLYVSCSRNSDSRSTSSVKLVFSRIWKFKIWKNKKIARNYSKSKIRIFEKLKIVKKFKTQEKGFQLRHKWPVPRSSLPWRHLWMIFLVKIRTKVEQWPDFSHFSGKISLTTTVTSPARQFCAEFLEQSGTGQNETGNGTGRPPTPRRTESHGKSSGIMEEKFLDNCCCYCKGSFRLALHLNTLLCYAQGSIS